MHESRNGNFTSSEIVALTTNGKAKDSMGEPAYTYIDECNMERRLGRSITDEIDARPLSWGKLNEGRVFDLLPLEYTLNSQETLKHPDFSCWYGSPDGFKIGDKKTVTDIKCPKTLKSFCRMVDAMRGGVEEFRKVKSGSKKVGEEYYWQLVSNAAISGCTHAELIVYMPYRSELEEIRERARNWDGPDQKSFYWIHVAEDNELPHLIDGGYYKNINKMLFEIPAEDFKFLESRVSLASNELEEFFKPKQ